MCFRLVQFLKRNISQNGVATSFRCGGICSDRFIANFLASVSVKKFWRSVNVWQRRGQKSVDFFESQCKRLLQLFLLCTGVSYWLVYSRVCSLHRRSRQLQNVTDVYRRNRSTLTDHIPLTHDLWPLALCQLCIHWRLIRLSTTSQIRTRFFMHSLFTSDRNGNTRVP